MHTTLEDADPMPWLSLGAVGLCPTQQPGLRLGLVPAQPLLGVTGQCHSKPSSMIVGSMPTGLSPSGS